MGNSCNVISMSMYLSKHESLDTVRFALFATYASSLLNPTLHESRTGIKDLSGDISVRVDTTLSLISTSFSHLRSSILPFEFLTLERANIFSDQVKLIFAPANETVYVR